MNLNVLMYNGDITYINELKVGDILMGDDSSPRTIKSIKYCTEDVYKIVPTFSESYELSENHILSLKYNTSPHIYKENGKFPRYRVRYAKKYTFNNLKKVKISTVGFSIIQRGDDIAKLEAEKFLEKISEHYEDPEYEVTICDYLTQPKGLNHRLVLYHSEGIDFSFIKNIDLDPYLLGLWLGDGDSADSTITNIDKEVVDYLYDQAEKLKVKLIRGKNTPKHKGEMKYRFGKDCNGQNIFLKLIKDNDLYRNKHIPNNYKYNTREVRLKILAGLIDTDGHYSNNSSYEIYQKNVRLANDIVFLARSLGYWCHIKPIKKGCWYKGEYKEGIYQKITFGGMKLENLPILIERKKAKTYLEDKAQNFLYHKFLVEHIGKKDVPKLEFEEDKKLFLLGDFTITHV